MELEPGIHQMTFGKEPLPGFPAPNSYLVFGTDTSILIDTGWENNDDHRSRMAYLRQTNSPPISEIIITHRHPDHGGGALHLHKEFGTPIACHEKDQEVIERDRLNSEIKIASSLNGGEVRDLGGINLELIHAPGHTFGCLSIYIPEREVLFTTDTVMDISTTSINPNDGSLVEYMQTLNLFQDINPRIMYTGHGRPVKNPRQRLNRLIDHRLRREESILNKLKVRPLSTAQLSDVIYKGLQSSRKPLAERQIITTLLKLLEEGKVVKEENETYKTNL